MNKTSHNHPHHHPQAHQAQAPMIHHLHQVNVTLLREAARHPPQALTHHHHQAPAAAHQPAQAQTAAHRHLTAAQAQAHHLTTPTRLRNSTTNAQT